MVECHDAAERVLCIISDACLKAVPPSSRVLLVAFEQHSGFHRRFSKVGRFVRSSPPLFTANGVPVAARFGSGVGGLSSSPRTTRERGALAQKCSSHRKFSLRPPRALGSVPHPNGNLRFKSRRV